MAIIRTVNRDEFEKLKNNSDFIPQQDIFIRDNFVGFIIEKGELITIEVEDGACND